MKKLKYTIIIVLLGLVISCNDFLNKQPLDELSNGTFWKTEADADMALAGVYHQMQWDIICDEIGVWDGLSDNGWAQYSWMNGFYQTAKGDLNSTTALPSAVWADCYTGISACNTFLANIVNIETSNKDVYILRYSAEVKFLRAFCYYWLTQCFGGVPLITEPQTLQNMKVARSTKDAVLNQMYDDLDYAIANLPDVAYSGHAVKASALALKARVKLFNGVYADAVSLAQQIIDGGKFSLALDYRSNFLESHNQNICPEIIFSIQFLGPINPNVSDQTYGWWGSLLPLKEFVSSHEAGDIRLPANVLQPGDPWPLGEKQQGTPNFIGDAQFVGTHYNENKWVNQETATPANWALLGNDATHLRYAEVLLVYAEAENELSGPSASVYNALNLVRNRAGLADLPTGLSQVDLREKIRHERRVELAFEGQRYFDLIRWGIASSIIPTISEPPNSTTSFRLWKDNYKLLPIPQAEIDKNPSLVQNPGY